MNPREGKPLDAGARNRAERRSTRTQTRIDYEGSAERYAELTAEGVKVAGPLAEAARHHERSTTNRKARRKSARAARRTNR